jgi:hypothetical protein
MRAAKWVLMVLHAGVLALAGCARQERPQTVLQGVQVDLPKLREAFTTASPEL